MPGMNFCEYPRSYGNPPERATSQKQQNGSAHKPSPPPIRQQDREEFAIVYGVRRRDIRSSHFYPFDFLNFLQRARCAAAILALLFADIVRFGTTLAVPLDFAQRAL